MADAQEVAKQLADHIKQEAAEYWPGATLLSVIDGAGQMTDGYVWCDLAGKTVRCIVPSAINLTGANHIIYGIPLGNGSNDFICIGVAWNGLDNSRLPRMRVAAITDIDNNPISGGGVSSVAMSAAPASVFGVSGSPITGSGTLALTMDNQNANIVLAGPTTGGAAEPSFRSLVAADIPDISATYLTVANYKKVVDLTGTYGETLSARDYVYLKASDSKWYKVDTNATDTVKVSSLRGFAIDAGDANATGTIRISGPVDGFTSLTAGAAVYASTTAGGYTQTRPAVTDGGDQIAIIIAGYANSTTQVIAKPGWVDYAKRSTLANNATLTIEHHDNADTMTRSAFATILTAVSGSSLTTYANVNKDVGVPLRGPSGAGGTLTVTQTGTNSGIGDAAGVEYAEAQSFIPTGGRLTQFTILLDANVGSPTGNITWEIQTDSAGLPSNTVLQTGSFAPTASATNTITVSDGICLSGSSTYHLVLKTVAQPNDTSYRWHSGTSAPYANGQHTYSSSPFTSWSTVANDCQFTVTTVALSVGDKLSQGIQVTGDQSVGAANLYMAKIGSPTGTMTLRIETDNAGSPSGTLVDAAATTTLAESELGTSYASTTFVFASSFTLTDSTQYHLVLSTDRASSNTNYVLWGADSSSPGYTSGVMKSEASSSWSAESKDACFDILGVTTYYNEPCVMGRVSGGTRDCAVRYDDGSSASEDTKTTFKNTTGGSVDMTCIVRLQ
jgi:hypothetical protein